MNFPYWHSKVHGFVIVGDGFLVSISVYCVNIELCYFRIVFGVFFVLNLLLWMEGSSAVVPLTQLVILVGLWFGISVPLMCLGAYLGFRIPVRYFLFCDLLLADIHCRCCLVCCDY